MMKISLKSVLMLGAVASVASCGAAIEEFIEDEVGRRANDIAGERLLQVHGSTNLNGATRTGSMSVDGVGNVTVTPVGNVQNGSVRVNANLGDMDELTMTNGADSVRFRKSDGDTIDDGADRLLISATSADGTRRGMLGNPLALDFDHQTFGVWADGVGTSNTSVAVGTFGNRTAASDVPTSGSATYNGTSAGILVNPTGTAVATQSQITVTTSDFSNVAVASTNTYASNLAGGAAWRVQHLDFAGTGTVSGNTFDSNINGVVAYSATSTGTVDGYFYGDEAEEVGGTFEMNGVIGSYQGAFGAD